MRIVFIGLATSFTDGMKYQDNILLEQFHKDGHDVCFISNSEKFINGILVTTNNEVEYTKSGVEIHRTKFRHIINTSLTSKIRYTTDIMKILDLKRPDIIYLHNFQTHSIYQIIKYLKQNPSTILLVDSHTDFNNSATSFLSKYLLHKLIYGHYYKSIYKYSTKIYYLSDEIKEYLDWLYRKKADKLEFMPLGGILFDKNQKLQNRVIINNKYSITNNNILLSHTGKFNKKKKTIELIKYFKKYKSRNMILMLVGAVEKDISDSFFEEIRNDKSIIYDGWKTGDELLDLISASDVYLQPGSQSATIQMAISCGCTVVCYPHKSYLSFFKNVPIYVKDEIDIKNMFDNISEKNNLNVKSEETFNFAVNNLDYKSICRKILKINIKENVNEMD